MSKNSTLLKQAVTESGELHLSAQLAASIIRLVELDERQLDEALKCIDELKRLFDELPAGTV